MKTVREACVLRPEVLKGDLSDELFGADFGQVVEGRAPDVYQRPELFFRNTHPAAPLKKIVTTIFDRLANPNEAGAAMRLSTGFGGGKTHTLIALWHLANHIADLSLGTELLPAAGRPKQVVAAGIDAGKFGRTVCVTHPDVETHSLWGEMAYQLGGLLGYRDMQSIDGPATQPNAARVRAMLPDAPVLIMVDELVIYMATLNDQEQGALLAFLNLLIAEVGARRQAVLVITDTAGETAYHKQASALAQLEAGQRLGDVVKRKVSDFDPVGEETAQVITRRLFETVDTTAANEASAEYFNAYQRVHAQYPELLPAEAPEYAKRIVKCYPFHPRLLETARERLGALQDFQKSRGVLRMFARILRDAWDGQSDATFVTAGDLDWQSGRIQADLLTRLGRDNFTAAVDADVIRHAGKLDDEYATDIHCRVASALLLESLPLAETAAMDKRELTLAVLRPNEVGNEAAEAMDRLMSACWHLYKDVSGLKYQFRYAPNANKIIEDRARGISTEDAKGAVWTLVQTYFGGHTFALVAYPDTPRSVADSAELKLVLCKSESLAQAVCAYEDDSDPAAKRPRRFRNAIFGVAPSPRLLGDAITATRRKLAAERVAEEYRKGTPVRTQVDELLLGITRNAQVAAMRAFDRVVFQGRPSLTLDEQYLVPRDSPLSGLSGQAKLKDFLDANRLIYQPTDALDVDLLITLMQGATPSLDHEGAFPASSVHERALASDKLRLMLNEEPVRRAVLKGVEQGKLVVRQANGDVYDQAGCVSGPAGDRQRHAGWKLTTLKLTADVLLAEPGAPCVTDWLKVDEATTAEPRDVRSVAEAAAVKQVGEQDIVDALDAGQMDGVWQSGVRYVVDNERFRSWKPSKPDEVTACTWQTAIGYAATRPLKALKFKTTLLAAADKLIACAPPFGARQLDLSVMASGAVKEGGTVKFAVYNVKHTSPLKPIETARRLLQVAPDSATFSAELVLDFGGQSLPSSAGLFEQAQRQAVAGLELEATFGPEAPSQGNAI